MNRLVYLLALPFFLLGTAFAQTGGTDLPGFDTSSLRLLGSSVWTLGFTVFSVVASVKRWTEVQGTPIKLNPWIWRSGSFAVGLLAAFALHGSGFGAMLPLFGAVGLQAVLLYGVAAGLVAIFGRDTAKTVISWVTVGLATALSWRAQTAEAGQPVSGAVVTQAKPEGHE